MGKTSVHITQDGKDRLLCMFNIVKKINKDRKGACVCFSLLVPISVYVVLCVGLSVSTYVCLSFSLCVPAVSPIYISIYLSVFSFSLCLSICLHRWCNFQNAEQKSSVQKTQRLLMVRSRRTLSRVTTLMFVLHCLPTIHKG